MTTEQDRRSDYLERMLNAAGNPLVPNERHAQPDGPWLL